MTRRWNPDDIPDPGSILDSGVYELEIESIPEKTSGTGKAMYVGRFSVVEPKLHAGATYYENFVLGSDDDLNADDPATLRASVGARILKRVLVAAGVPLSDDLDHDTTVAVGQHVVAVIAQQIDDGSRDARFKGRVRNTVSAWYAVGERAPALDAPAPLPPRAAPPRQAAPATTRPPQRATAEAQEELQAAAPPARRGRPPGSAAAKAAAEELLVCVICRQQVTRSGYVAHIKAHEADDQE